MQTAEGELEIAGAADPGRGGEVRERRAPEGADGPADEAVGALIIGAWVLGLADRDIASLVEDEGLGRLSNTAVCEITNELRARYRAFRAQGFWCCA